MFDAVPKLRFISILPFTSQPVIEKAPTSCRCGGDTAYVARVGDRLVMLGCVCHHEHVVYARDVWWEVLTLRREE